MKLDVTSLAIGAGIGIVVAVAAIVVFVMQPGRIVLDETAMAAIVSNNGSHFFMSGLIKEISDDEMIIDQTFGNPNQDNPNVKIKTESGWAFVACRGTGTPNETCEDSVKSRLDEGVHVCALTRMYDGEFYAGKMWADSGCGPFGIEENKTG